MKSNKKAMLSCLLMAAASCVLLSGCKKEEVQETTDVILAAVAMTDLQQGCFYVKSGDAFYLLPNEDQNYDVTKEIFSTNDTKNGIINQDENRLVNFTQKDLAIPTLYKNDQLIYVSDGSLSSFIWERFKDYGYSIGLSSLQLSSSGKIKSQETTMAAVGSTAEAAIASLTIPEGADITVDKINGTALSSQYINDGGIITGMSRDALASVDFYIGTQHVPVSISADTRYFKSFELYATENYALSTDGYAIVEIPSYLRSGYYMINGIGFVKYLNVDRGVDESGIDLDSAYYYTSKDGKTLTYYEWQEENGLLSASSDVFGQTQNESIDIEKFPERYLLTLDSTQATVHIDVAYRYINDKYRLEASKNGTFPRIYLLDPTNKATALIENESRTYGQDNKENYTYLKTSVDGPIAGEWYLLFENFDNIQKNISVTIDSGNATSYLHHGSIGTIDVYYDGSDKPHDISVTWENADRAAKEIKITAPDGTVYSKEQTPGNIMADEYGRYMVKLPNITEGNYHFEIKGEGLGRVWINSDESVALNTDNTEMPIINEPDSSEEPQPSAEESEVSESEETTASIS